MMDLFPADGSYIAPTLPPGRDNLGMNIGKAAGAGIAGHIHMHALPRWVGELNFMTVVGETRMLPESLDDL